MMKTPPVATNVQFQQAVALFQSGQLESARTICMRVLKQEARHAPALHLLGILAYQARRFDDARRFLMKAAAINPTNATFHSNVGNVLQELGQHESALVSYDRAIALQPESAEAHYNRASALQELKRYDDAIAGYTRTVVLEPGFTGAYFNRALAFHESGRPAEAIADYDREIALSPGDARAHYNRGNALQDMQADAEAVASYDRVIALEPDFTPAYFNRGNALTKLGRSGEAIECYRRVLSVDPGHAEAQKRLLWIAIVSGLPAHQLDAAVAEVCAAIAVGEARLLETQKTLRAFRAQHDCEQGAYLLARGKAYDGLREAQDVLTGIVARKSRQGAVHVTQNEINTLNHARKNVVRDGGNDVAEGLNPDNDWRALEELYLSATPELVVIDEFLTPPALAELQRFCLASTVWRNEYDNHYLGAFANQGFVNPLLLRLVQELRTKMPRIFDDHSFEQLWAFKYDSKMGRGINVHADFARINLNFWITPDEANLDPNSGGMIVYDVAAPTSWRFHEYNNDPKRIYRFLEESASGKRTVPYKCNRAVLFNSNLFHETDAIHFREGYENRRINITYLFGRGLSE